jgi:hypothetical protein
MHGPLLDKETCDLGQPCAMQQHTRHPKLTYRVQECVCAAHTDSRGRKLSQQREVAILPGGVPSLLCVSHARYKA